QDQYEREADRIAKQVVTRATSSAVQQQESQDEHTAQRRLTVHPQGVEGGTPVTPDVEAAIQGTHGGGQPLPETLRSSMERAFNTNFSDVRVHTDAQADQLNRSLQAQAFTAGRNIFFRQGEYSPGNMGGRELLTHELTHVVQQSGLETRTLRIQRLVA